MSNHEKLKVDFKKLANEGKLSHAYLFFGENNNSEKLAFANSLANFLENGVFGESDKLLRETLVISPDEKGTIGIDCVRNLKFFLWQKPSVCAKRIAIIQGAENMTPEAQNAALKIVEEPPEAALIIFIALSGENLLPALNSRLQKIYFSSGAEKQEPKIKITVDQLLNEDVIGDNQLDDFFKQLILKLGKDPIKNLEQLKEVLNRLVAIKQYNTNKKLQLKTLKI
jgi:DNA polymerase III delta prime subunit